jgi:ppGpp synthetase/RelA/SpoT-type nucleotidyltranferase
MDAQAREWHKSQVGLYIRERPIYERYADLLARLLREASHALAPGATIEARAKTVSSFAEKAIRKRHKYSDPVHQLTDLCGARVITATQEEVHRVCRFIRQNFIVDEANSDDKRALLSASQFGYLSVHLVVQMPAEVAGERIPEEIGPRKAEIQVRTALQHAWARVGHDKVYKSPFPVPERWQREMNRAAALLEGADRDFSVVLENLARFATNHGAFLSEEEIQGEIEVLRLVAAGERDESQRRRLACRIASLAKSQGKWKEAADELESYQDSADATVLRELGHAVCFLHWGDKAGAGFRRGQHLLERAVGVDPQDAQAHALLAWSWEELDEDRARLHFARAHELKPHDPYFLASYLEHQMAVERQTRGLSLLGPALGAAVEICRDHASVGIELPWALFTEARLRLCLYQPHEALSAAAKAVRIVRSPQRGAPSEVLEEEVRALKRLSPLRDAVPGHEWVRRFLNLARASRADLAGEATPGLEIAPPVVILAGSCNSLSSEQAATYGSWLRAAFSSFRGTVFCGGTISGLSGIVGSLSGGDVRTIGYHPQYLPSRAVVDSRYTQLVPTKGAAGFSPLEPLQMWTDLLSRGIPPAHVRVIGLGGRTISVLEYQMALALGAEVGVVENSGRAVDDLLRDDFWRREKNLIRLPADRMSLKAFLGPPMETAPGWLEAAARVVHEKYRADNKHVLVDPSMRPWEELDEPYRDSNRQQAAYAAEILHGAGFAVRRLAGPAPAEVAFTSQEVESMAEMEHGRWVVERRRKGWTLGPRDPLKKISPYLVPWAELPENVKQWDRDAVRAFPEVLGKAGLEIHRLSTESGRR